MCGIAGIISPRELSEALSTMLQVQAHRGPDHTGTYLDEGFAALGHNRLSIIDLSADANEPFTDSNERYYLSFNGEIYNYKELREELKERYTFRTTSDTEVLLAAFMAWGEDCLQHFNGMFAFAIWDSQEKILFAARDRFGVKPFYYSLEEGSLYFSSEVKALRSVLHRSPNPQVWAGYFSYGSYGSTEETFYTDIHQLPAGHFMRFKAGEIALIRWYDFVGRVREVNTNHSFEEAKDKYLQLLKESVSLRFRADVPVGFNLSGGADSSLLLALVNQMEGHKKVNAYTFFTGDERYDELLWVDQMIATTGNPLTKVKLSAEEVPSLSRLIASFQDEPYGGIPTLAYAKIFEQARKDGIKVLLDGQGMDEQWAGYDYYVETPSSSSTSPAGGAVTIQGTGLASPFRTSVLSREFAALAEEPSYPAPFDNRLQNLQYRDLFHTKIPRALRFNDRISMAYSTELREPFLDYRLVEFAFAQPKAFKISQGTQKYLLRDLLKNLAPRELTYAPKRPLQTPQREWLGEELKDFVEAQLEQLKRSSFSHWFEQGAIDREWNSYLKGNKESSFHLWQWVSLALCE